MTVLRSMMLVLVFFSTQIFAFDFVGPERSVLLVGDDVPYMSSSAELNLSLASFGDTFSDEILGQTVFAEGLVSATAKAFYENQGLMDMVVGAKFQPIIFSDTNKPTLEVGDSLFLGGTMAPISGRVDIRQNGPRAALDISALVAARVGAEVCFVKCATLDIGFNEGLSERVLGIDIPAGSLTVLGETEFSLPKTITDDSGLVTATAQPVDFSETKFGFPFDGEMIASRQAFAAADVNIAQIVANAFGLPFPLKGEKLGFDYNILEISTGLGLDLAHEVEFNNTTLAIDYEFSSPVRRVRDNGGLGPEEQTIRVLPGRSVVVTPAARSVNLGVIPKYKLLTIPISKWNAIVKISGALRALELSGYGIDLGPLLNESLSQDITSFLLDSAVESIELETVDQPINIPFERITVDDAGTVSDLCEDINCLSTGFVDTIETLDENGLEFTQSTTYLVQDVTASNCGDGILDGCEVDPSFDPKVVQIAFPEDPDELSEVAVDFEIARRLLDAIAKVGGPESNDEMLSQLLLDVGALADGATFGRTIGDGAPPLTEPLESDISFFYPPVPEPSAGLLALLASVSLLACRGTFNVEPGAYFPVRQSRRRRTPLR